MQFSTKQTRPHRSKSVEHWRTWWKPLLPLHSRPEQFGWKCQKFQILQQIASLIIKN